MRPSTFIRLHDGMPDHPKVDPLSDKAFRMLVTAWCWSSKYLTDGRIPQAKWKKWFTPKARAELLSAGLAEELPGGDIQMHDYLEWQRSAQEVREFQEAKAAGGSIGNHVRWHVDRGIVKPDCEFCTESKPRISSQMRSQTASQMRSQTDRTSSPETSTETELLPPIPPSPDDASATAEQAGEGDQDPQNMIDLALVDDVRAIRPDWTSGTIGKALAHPDVLERPAELRRPAILALARDPESRSPGRLRHDGPWWQAGLRKPQITPSPGRWTAPQSAPASTEAKDAALDEYIRDQPWYRRAKTP